MHDIIIYHNVTIVNFRFECNDLTASAVERIHSVMIQRKRPIAVKPKFLHVGTLV